MTEALAVPSEEGGRRSREPSMRRRVARTAVFNVVSTVAGALTGVIIARALGAEGRGEYAAIMVWYFVVLQLGQLGQTTATTYYVARHPDEGRNFLASSRTVMLLTGSITLLGGIVATPLLARDDSVVWGHRLMFATCLAAFVGASYTFSLLAVNSARWNLVRVSQPIIFLAAVATINALGQLRLTTVLFAYSGTIVLQTGVAYWLCRREELHGGRTRRKSIRLLVRYGMGQVSSAIPRIISSRLDQLVLSLAVAPAVLGNYAVALTLVTLTGPFTSALASAVFPRFAAGTMSAGQARRMQRRTLLVGATVSVGMVALLAGSAPWLMPTLFGAGFSDAAWYAMLLAPAGIFLGCEKVCEGLLRGHGKPYAVARAHLAAAFVMAPAVAVLVWQWGAAGAAIANGLAAGVGLLLMLRSLRRLVRSGDGHGPNLPAARGGRRRPVEEPAQNI